MLRWLFGLHLLLWSLGSVLGHELNVDDPRQ
jgi:hypothetical protein